MTRRYSGKCLCGAVTFKIEGSPVIVAQCHCEECRRTSGTGHTIGTMFAESSVSLRGKLTEFSYKSGLNSKVTKAFCANCGSPILGRNTRSPDHVTLPLGTFNDASDLEVQVVIFDRDKQHWDQLGKDVVSFATQPNWKPNS